MKSVELNTRANNELRMYKLHSSFLHYIAVSDGDGRKRIAEPRAGAD